MQQCSLDHNSSLLLWWMRFLIKQELQEMRDRDMKSLMKEMKIGGLSIKNVYMRLFLAYGKHMIFEISNKSEGICITVGGNYEDTSTGSGR